MPRTRVILYREADGTVPVLKWLATLPAKGKAKCQERLEALRDFGHELRRPHADYLRDGIYELRAKWGGELSNAVLLPRKRAAVVSHGIVKQGRCRRKRSTGRRSGSANSRRTRRFTPTARIDPVMVETKEGHLRALRHSPSTILRRQAPELAVLEEERANAEVARKMYELRTNAGLTQKELAKVGRYPASVISRLEETTTKGTRWRCAPHRQQPSTNASRFASSPRRVATWPRVPSGLAKTVNRRAV